MRSPLPDAKIEIFYYTLEGIAMKNLFAFAALAVAALNTHAEIVGDVSTTFRWVGANNKIVVDVFDDPKVNGVSCYLSHAKTGGKPQKRQTCPRQGQGYL